jgi:uncharacterized protein (TIGR03083 family)
LDGLVTELVDSTITELRAIHDRLAARVSGLSAKELTGPSGAEDWTVADVLSHLGSGAEIGRHPVQAALTREPVEAPDNQEVWDRWNAMTPQDQAASFVKSDEQSVAAFESFTPQQRDSVTIDLGFLPQPVPLATALGMRLNELAMHGWDVEAGLDPSAALSDRSAALLLQHFSDTLTFMLGFIGKPDDAPAARVAVAGTHSIVIDGEGVRLEAGTDGATATFEGPAEAAVRLLAGRLRPGFTPSGVAVSGAVSLDDLRKVFPGY